MAAFHAGSLGSQSAEDYLALEARLFKDLAFRRHGGAELLARAAQAYERVAQRTDGSYSRQNAALLYALAGNEERAANLARSVVERLSGTAPPLEEEPAYFHWATLAQAALVLEDRSLFEHACGRADCLCRRNSWARSRTFSEMQRLGSSRPGWADLIDAWYRPAVGFLLPSDCAAVGLAASLERSDPPALVYCVGALGDWRALATNGVQIHAIYPLAAANGLASANASAAIGGSSREAAAISVRHDASGHADSHTWSSLLLDEDEDHESLCAEAALGLSLAHADTLRAPWVALSRTGDRWRVHRQPDLERIRAAVGVRMHGGEPRARYGFLFADAVSYSSLSAADTRRYWLELLPKTAALVLRRHASSIVLRKTWGDAVHAVFRTASAAASAALEMQAATAQLTEELGGRGQRLAFRIAVHYGAADRGFDPVEDAPAVFGPQLSYAARIVPVAPPGGVFATEPCAAQLQLEGAADIGCAYVGTISLPKSYGRVRLLRLA